MSERFNFKDAKTTGSGDFEPLPDGVYPAKITGAELTTAQSSGNPMIKLTLQISSGEYAKRLVWDNLVWTQAAFWKIKNIAEATNIPSNQAADAGIEEVADELLNMNVDILLESKTNSNGKLQNVVKKYLPQEQTAPVVSNKAKFMQ